MRAVLVIGRLALGGAELQTIALARGLANRGHDVRLITLFAGGALAGALEGSGVEHRSLSRTEPGRPWRSAAALLAAPRRLRALLRARPADVVWSSLYAANVVAASALRPGGPGGPPLVFALRAAQAELGPVRAFFFRRAARLSSRAAALVANTRAGLDDHVARGFGAAERHVVANGVDTELFRPDAAAGRAARRQWGLPVDVAVVGRVGRLSPVKDHETFLAALAHLRGRVPEVHGLCVGDGPPAFRAALEARAAALGLATRVRFTGACARDRLPGLYAAMDVAVSSSRSEGFPNVVAEAMACGVPVVATDVGGTAQLIGSEGRLVPPGDAVGLAEGVGRALEAPGDLGAARRRIVERFSVARMVDETEALLLRLTSR